MKLLLIRFSSIGDIVLTTPVIRCLKLQRPGDEIHFFTKPEFGDMLAASPYIEKVHLLDPEPGKQYRKLAGEGFDELIDLHHNARTLRIKNAMGIPSFSFPKLNGQKWLMVKFKWNFLPDQSVVDRYMDTVNHLGVINDHQGLDYFIPPADRVSEGTLPVSHASGFIALAIGAAHFTKRLPVEKLKELCDRIHYPILLLGGKEDIPAAEVLTSSDSQKIFNGCGKFSINASADLVRQAKLVISHDTGLMHIATAFKKPLISIWGNTIPEFGMFPYYGYNNLQFPDDRMDIIQHKGLYCRPCTKIGYSRCPKGHFRCMQDLDMQEIATRVEQKMRKAIN